MAAGAAVIAEKGFEAATMTEIAARAQASIGSLYQFFPTKELLADAVHDAQLEALTGMLDELREQAPGRTTAELAEALFDRLPLFLDAHPAFMILADRRQLDHERKRVTRALLRERIADLLTQASPPLPPGRARILATVILHLMKAAMVLQGTEDEPLRSAALSELRAMLKVRLAATGNG